MVGDVGRTEARLILLGRTVGVPDCRRGPGILPGTDHQAQGHGAAEKGRRRRMKYVNWKRLPKCWIGTVSTGEQMFRIEQRKRRDGSRPARTTLLYRLPAGGAEIRRGVWSAKD